MSRDAYRDMLATAYQQIRLAVALYAGRDAVERLAVQVNARFRYFESASTSAAALIFADHVHLTITGSNDIHDWVQNFSAVQSQVDLLDAHSGFVAASEWIRRELRGSDLASLIRDRRLILGGHSSGGCIAQLLSLDPAYRPQEIYTFGSPRVFSSLSAAIYSAFPWETARFVMEDDPVPRLPLRKFRLLFGGATYAHVTAPLMLTDDGKVLAEQGMGTLQKLWTMAKSVYLWGATALAVLRSTLPSMLDAHASDRYRNAIKKALFKEGL